MPPTKPDLNRVMAAYRDLTTDQLVSDTIVLTQGGIDASHWAAAAYIGFSRAKHYIDMGRNLIYHILEGSDEIDLNMLACKDLMDSLRIRPQTPTLTKAIVAAAASYRIGATALSVHEELLWHFYTSSLKHAWYFLENSVRIVDPTYKPSTEAAAAINLIREFRNHMEHRDQATLNLASHDWFSMSRKAKGTITIGYTRDDSNNIEFKSSEKGPFKGRKVKMPINLNGFNHFEQLIQDQYEHLCGECLARLQIHFIDHPETLPPITDVGKTLNDSLEEVGLTLIQGL